MTLPKTLLPNGISSQILTQLGATFVTRDKRPALLLPTMPGYQSRVVFLDGKYKKYAWEHKDQPHPPLFMAIPEGTKLAVITNGEKASLVLAQQGIPCANTFGEGNELGRAVEALQAAGVTSLLIVPDCDKAGIRAAHKWLTVAKETGLDIAILDLGAYLKRAYLMTAEEYHKYDLRDLWLLLEQDSDIFKEVLYSLPHVNFDDYRDWLPDSSHTPFRPQDKKYEESASTQEIQKLYDQWWDKVLAAVSDHAPRGNIHRHQHCKNPQHADRDPSFRITKDMTPICTCYEARNKNNVASYYDVIAWKDFLQAHFKEKWEQRKQAREERRKDHVNREAKKVIPLKVKRSKYADLVALPTPLRKAIIYDKQTNLGRIVDVLLHKHVPVDQPLSRKEIAVMMQDFEMGQSAVYRVFETDSHFLNAENRPEILNLRIRNEAGIFYTLDSLLSSLEQHYRYSIHTNGDLLHHHETTLCSAKEYRQYALLECFSLDVEITKSGKKLAQEFNLSAGTISTYTRALRDQHLLEITAHYKRHEITPDEFGNLSVTLADYWRLFSNCYIEMYIVKDGRRYECLHKGGKKGIPNNRIPAAYDAVMHFFEKNVKSNKLKTGREFSNMAFVLVSKKANSYRRVTQEETRLAA